MTLEEIVLVLERRLVTLAEHRTASASVGDLEAVVKIDAEIEQSKQTLER